MTKGFTAANYMEKAVRAVKGARVLLDSKDTEGACSRAYYAMFDAAHAALRALGIETEGAEIKTHNGLLTIFSKELIQANRINTDLRKALNQVEHLRSVADYSAEPPPLDKAAWAVEQAEAFVAEIKTKFMSVPKGKPKPGTE